VYKLGAPFDAPGLIREMIVLDHQSEQARVIIATQMECPRGFVDASAIWQKPPDSAPSIMTRIRPAKTEAVLAEMRDHAVRLVAQVRGPRKVLSGHPSEILEGLFGRRPIATTTSIGARIAGATWSGCTVKRMISWVASGRTDALR
jgi:hypothetical protein